MTILVLIGKVYLWCCYCYSYESFFPFLPTELSFESKVKFRQASNHCKMVLKVAKHAYANKRNSITSQKLGFWNFWRINNSVLNKGKSVVPLLFNGPEVLSSASDKAKLFSKSYSRKSNLDGSGILLPFFPSRTNLKLYNVSVFPKMTKRS